MNGVVEISDGFSCNECNDNDINMNKRCWIRNNVNGVHLNNMCCDHVSHCFSEHTCSTGRSDHHQGSDTGLNINFLYRKLP